MDIQQRIDEMLQEKVNLQRRRMALHQEREANFKKFIDEGVKTPAQVRDRINDELQQIAMEQAALERGIRRLRDKFGANGFWNYSDMLLQELMLLCEEEGKFSLVHRARKRLDLKIKANAPR